MNRLAALDGIRGVAVICVVLAHALVPMAASGNPIATVAMTLLSGDMGVLAFFVLSGFLITTLLVRERGGSGRINLAQFYVRRALRIFPAFYFFLAILSILAISGFVSISGGAVLSSALYVWNYSPAAEGWWLGHTWSLAVEEQFYLLWPFLIVLLRPDRAVKVAALYIVFAPFIRVGSYVLLPDSRTHIGIMFHTRADSLLSGCLLALLPVVYPALWTRVKGLVQRSWVVPAAVATLLFSNVVDAMVGGAWMLSFGYTISNTAVAVVIAAIVVNPRGRTSRIMAWRPLVFVGILSYSLYLWQQPFLYYGEDPPFFAQRWWSLPAVIVVACFSYFAIERPALRLKSRFASRSETRAL